MSETPNKKTSKRCALAVFVGILAVSAPARAETDQDRWRAMMEPASVAHLTGAYGEAEFRYLEALTLAETFDRDGGYLERAMAGLGGVYYSQRRYAEAAAFFREALDIATALYGGDHDRRAVIEIYRDTLVAAEAAIRAPEAVVHRAVGIVFSKQGAAVPLRGRAAPRPVPSESVLVGGNGTGAGQPRAGRTILATAEVPLRGGPPPAALPTYLPLRGMPVQAFEAKVAATLGWTTEVAVARADETDRPSAGPDARAGEGAADSSDYGGGPLVIRITPRKPAKERKPQTAAAGGPRPASAAALQALQADPLAPPNVSLSAIAREQAEEVARRRELVKRHPVLGIKLPSAKRNMGPIFPGTPRLADTEQAYVEELEAREVAYGSRHPEVADLLYRLARLYHRQSRYELASTMYERCLAAREKLLPDGHPDIVETLRHYIRLMRASGFPEKVAALKERMKEHETKALAAKE